MNEIQRLIATLRKSRLLMKYEGPWDITIYFYYKKPNGKVEDEKYKDILWGDDDISWDFVVSGFIEFLSRILDEEAKVYLSDNAVEVLKEIIPSEPSFRIEVDEEGKLVIDGKGINEEDAKILVQNHIYGLSVEKVKNPEALHYTEEDHAVYEMYERERGG